MSPAQKRIHLAALQLFAEKSVGELNVSELAQAAGVARGTIYNNLESVESLFEDVATQLAHEMNQRVKNSDPDMDPVERFSNGVRFYIRRAHEEPNWGRFIARYGATNSTLRDFWAGVAANDLLSGLAQQRFNFREEQLPSVFALVAGSVMVSMMLVLDGHKTWREAGSETAELVLRALGIPNDEARRIACQELPPLPAVD